MTTLFRAIKRRHTNRGTFERQPLDGSELAQIAALVVEHPEFLTLISGEKQKEAVQLIEQGSRKQLARPAVRQELADWLRPSDDFTDGVQPDSLGIPGPVAPFAAWLVRNLDMSPIEARRDRGRADQAPLLLLVTADDDRVSLVRAGEVLELLLLTITNLHLAYSFLNHPVEVETMRESLHALAGCINPPQLLLRIGYAQPVAKATPRRNVRAARRK